MSLPRVWSYREDQDGSLERGPTAAASQNEVVQAVIDENMNQQQDLLGSLFSIHSAPVYELNSGNGSPKRPASLVVQVTASSTPIVPPHYTPDTVDDEDNDNLLTISSLTARPLIAKSRELRSKSSKRVVLKKNPRKKKNPENIVPPDGGYGWVVVFGAFFVQFWVAGLVKSYGVLYVEVMETFKGSSATLASWTPAVLSCLCLMLAPVTSVLCQKYSCRSVVFVGGLFCSLGLVASYFATSLVHLLFSFGVLTGIGGGLSTTPGIILVSQYFDKHRALANGICVSGTAAGSFVFPLLIDLLVRKFGFHGTILFLGGCMLHVCVSATLYRPLTGKDEDDTVKNSPTEESAEQIAKSKQQNLEFLFANDNSTRHNNTINNIFHGKNATTVELTDSEEEKDTMGEITMKMKTIPKIRSSSLLHSVEDLTTDSTCVYKNRSSLRSLRSSATAVYPPTFLGQTTGSDEQVNDKKKSIMQKIARYLDLSLLKEPQFMMMCLSVSLMSTGSPYMLYYLPAFVTTEGYAKSDAGYLVAISAVLDLCGRLGLGYLSDLHVFDRKKGYIGSIVGAGIAVLAIPMARSFYVLACSVSVYGLCLGCWFLLVPVLLADQYGTEKISSTYGLVRMFQGVSAIVVPPLTGFVRDTTGSYSICFVGMGVCMVLGGLPMLLVSDSNNNSTKSVEVASKGTIKESETSVNA